MQRAGHSNFGTTQIYVRTAEAIRDGFGDVFPPLPLFLAFEVSRNGPLGWPTDRVSARNYVEPTGIENMLATSSHRSRTNSERLTSAESFRVRKHGAILDRASNFLSR
jgi:hypothetical protein